MKDTMEIHGKMYVYKCKISTTYSIFDIFLYFIFLINVDFWFVFVSPPSLCTDCMWAGLVFGFSTLVTLDDLLNFFFLSTSKS